MKVKVINQYIDKNTSQLMEVGYVAEYEPERARELINKGFVEEVKSKTKSIK